MILTVFSQSAFFEGSNQLYKFHLLYSELFLAHTKRWTPAINSLCVSEMKPKPDTSDFLSVIRAVFHWLRKPTWSQRGLETCIFTTLTWSHFTPNLLVASEEESGDHRDVTDDTSWSPPWWQRGEKQGTGKVISVPVGTDDVTASLSNGRWDISGPQWCHSWLSHLQSRAA